jgi:transcriptional regulator with AAA-type ATPase domain
MLAGGVSEMNRRQFASLLAIPAADKEPPASNLSLADVEVREIIARLKKFNFDTRKTARDLEITHRALWYRMRQHGIVGPDVGPGAP